MITAISPDDLCAALRLRDLSDPSHGPHAMQLLLDDAVAALADRWGCAVDVQRRGALVSVEDNYDRLGYCGAAVTRDARYTRYAAETVMLRSHTSAGIPPALRALSGHAPEDLLLVLPGLVYRRDSIDRLHVGTPHQLDLWRITNARMTNDDLLGMIATLVEAALPGARWRVTPAVHPYTVDGLQVDVQTEDGWVELAECGLAAPRVLAGAGLEPDRWSGLALGMGLDRAVMLRKGLDDIRLLRSADPRVAAQLLDLAPWHPVSMLPPIRRDLSIVITGEPDEELLGDAVRTALGERIDDLESLSVLSSTLYESLPPHVQDRLGMHPGQTNVLLRLTLRPIGRTLTDSEANVLRDQVYAAVHEGPVKEWAAQH
jgi:phenylalanyl-tRNA synthetase alpha chain